MLVLDTPSLLSVADSRGSGEDSRGGSSARMCSSCNASRRRFSRFASRSCSSCWRKYSTWSLSISITPASPCTMWGWSCALGINTYTRPSASFSCSTVSLFMRCLRAPSEMPRCRAASGMFIRSDIRCLNLVYRFIHGVYTVAAPDATR
jgi:hypothetical protein